MKLATQMTAVLPAELQSMESSRRIAAGTVVTLTFYPTTSVAVSAGGGAILACLSEIVGADLLAPHDAQPSPRAEGEPAEGKAL